MVNLACRRRGTNTSGINVIFLIDTGSQPSYLSAKSMEALIANTGSYLPQQLPFMIHSKKALVCHLSPHYKHFADVNVLGIDFLALIHRLRPEIFQLT